MTLRRLAKDFFPPLLLRWLKKHSGQALRFYGSPKTWSEAVGMSSGYSHDLILNRVVEATRAVVSGHAAFERDSVLFHEPSVPFRIVAVLLRSAALDDGRLEVIDFGGSLGSTFRQCRPFLDALRQIQWHVVEQPAFVEAGRREFSTPELTFHSSIADVPASETPATVIFSSVLQYLEDYRGVLEALVPLKCRHLLIDRSPFSSLASDHLCVQRVPEQIYNASYPCWILSRSRLLDALSRQWRLVSEFSCPEGECRTDEGLNFEFRGLILEKRS